MVTTTTSTPHAFDSTCGWQLSPKVGLRPEPFGALAYHFDTRRLLFLKSDDLVALVESLDTFATAADAIVAAVEASPTSQRSFELALATLADGGVIEPREAS